MLFAITRPGALLGLLLAFLLALTLRVVATRLTARALGLAPRHGRLLPQPREDIDPFGAVAAAIAGTGWGRAVDVDALPRWAGRGRKAMVVLAGPLTPLLAGQLGLLAHKLAYPDTALTGNASVALRGGWAPTFGEELLLSLSVGLLCFGLLNLLPMPPLDGWALVWVSARHIGPGLQWAHQWLVEKNLGVTILLIMVFFPLNRPFLYLFIDILAAPFLWVWE